MQAYFMSQKSKTSKKRAACEKYFAVLQAGSEHCVRAGSLDIGPAACRQALLQALAGRHRNWGQ